MPIKSYLAYPVRGRRDDVVGALRALPGCHVIPALNRDLLVVVTDTTDEAADEALHDALTRVEFLEGLALVAGMGEPGADPVCGSGDQA
jgi:nitrate reductase NapAB chaperone NapD